MTPFTLFYDSNLLLFNVSLPFFGGGVGFAWGFFTALKLPQGSCTYCLLMT